MTKSSILVLSPFNKMSPFSFTTTSFFNLAFCLKSHPLYAKLYLTLDLPYKVSDKRLSSFIPSFALLPLNI